MPVEIITFGCRLNAYESEVAQAHAQGAGLEDAVIVNTCAVTSEAVRQAGQAIRKAHRNKPGTPIIVTGCAAQIEPERFAAMPEVTHVIGNGEKSAKATYDALRHGLLERVRVNDIQSVRETAGHMLPGAGSRVRAYMEIQNGCDHSCTFCIIPQGRGPSRSVPAGLVVTKVRELADKGCKEVVLTGVDITSYGTGLPGGMTLGALVRSILKRVPHLPRLRLSSIDTIEADEVLIRAFAEEDRLMPHVHLSLQSGDDLILKRMKRRHCRADAIAFCENLRKLRPDIVFGADLIAGFPTEDDAMFGNTLRLADDCGLSFLHVFPFSPRPGTPAARMPQVNRNTVKSRAAQLREKGRLNLQAHFDRQKGRLVNALVEREGMARSPDFSEIHFKEAAAPGEIITARVTGSLNGRLTAMRVA